MNEVFDRAVTACNIFDDFEKIKKESVNVISMTDKKEQDILHFIENHELSMVERAKLMRELQEVRNQRREAKNVANALNTFEQHKTKLTSNKANRDILKAKVAKTVKNAEKCNYTNHSYSAYTLDELHEIIKLNWIEKLIDNKQHKGDIDIPFHLTLVNLD